MTERPAVSVIVPFLNAQSTLGALVRALGAQAPSALGRTEYLFVDNGSQDAGRQIVTDGPLRDARVLDEPEPGVSAARNRGLAEARGDVLALIDADCVPSRQWLRELSAPFEDPASIIAAGGLASYPPQTATQRFAARYGLNDASRNLLVSAIPFANGRNMAVRRNAAEAVGGWPADMTRAEDIEFSLRVCTTFECRIEYRPLALAFHQDRATDEELRQQAHGYGRGMAILYRRHPETLRWGWPERVRRARMSGRRRVGALRARLGRAAGMATADEREFAHYLAMWDESFWRGFFDERRAGAR